MNQKVPSDQSLPIISHAIQLAVAPVFLLTGVATLLVVMTNRLARIIDRARVFEQRWEQLNERARVAARNELVDLERRRRLASWATNFCICSALLVCIVIATLFVEAFFAADLKWLAGALFIGAMIGLIGGLSCFMREVYLATHTMRIDASGFEH